MAVQHGRDTYISFDGDDLSQFTDNSDFGRTAEAHKVTTYGKQSNVYAGGNKDGKMTAGGTYDTGATAAPKVLKPLVGETVVVVRRPEGTGTGKPQETVDVVITNYTESNPADGMVTWKVEGQLSDDVVDSVQA